MNRVVLSVLIAQLCFMMAGCVRPVTGIMADTDPVSWRAGESVEVVYDNRDSLAVRTVDIMVRFDRTFAYDRLGVAVTAVDPKFNHTRDTVYIEFPAGKVDPKTYVEMSEPYLSGVTFPLRGRYKFRFAPVMPERGIAGVSAIGVNIY